jgi:hypothetical protein
MRHIKRNVYTWARQTKGSKTATPKFFKKEVTISFYKEEPFIGYAFFNGKTWVVERNVDGKWVVNIEYSKVVQADEKRPARMMKLK